MIPSPLTAVPWNRMFSLRIRTATAGVQLWLCPASFCAPSHTGSIPCLLVWPVPHWAPPPGWSCTKNSLSSEVSLLQWNRYKTVTLGTHYHCQGTGCCQTGQSTLWQTQCMLREMLKKTWDLSGLYLRSKVIISSQDVLSVDNTNQIEILSCIFMLSNRFFLVNDVKC